MGAPALVSALTMVVCGLVSSSPAAPQLSTLNKLHSVSLTPDLGRHKRVQRSRLGKYYGQNSERFLRISSAAPAFESVAQFGSLMIQCEFVGSPPPTVDWLRDGTVIQQADLTESLEEQTNSLDSFTAAPSGRIMSTAARLYLDCVTPGDEGAYTCQGQTGYQAESVSTQLLVQDEVDEEGMAICERVKDMSVQPARVVQWRPRLLVKIGDRARLVCQTTGFPPPEVTWLRGGQVISDTSPRVTLMSNGDLVLEPLKWSDMGRYMCSAANEFGADQVSSFLYPFKG